MMWYAVAILILPLLVRCQSETTLSTILFPDVRLALNQKQAALSAEAIFLKAIDL